MDSRFRTERCVGRDAMEIRRMKRIRVDANLAFPCRVKWTATYYYRGWLAHKKRAPMHLAAVESCRDLAVPEAPNEGDRSICFLLLNG